VTALSTERPGAAVEDEFMTAAEAARALGVSRTTLYAYVGRKGLRSVPVPGSRQRLYWRPDIEQLSAKAPPPRPQGELNRESEITLITARGPFYRGRSAIELAESASLEEVASLLWGVPGPSPFGSEPPLSSPGFRAMADLLADEPAVDRASALFPFLEKANPRAYDLSPAGMARTGVDVLRWLAAILLDRGEASAEPLHLVFARSLGLTPPLTDLVRRALVLSADHAFEPTTFAVRAVASAGVSPWRAVMTGLMVATGRRSRFDQFDAMRRFIREVTQAADPAAPVLARLREGREIPGFNPGVYASADPRGRALLAYCAEAFGDEIEFKRLQTALALVKEVTDAEPNFALASAYAETRLGLGMLRAGVRSSANEAPFLLGRSAGWIAHAIEQYRFGESAHRPVVYKGPLPK
jgi:citrate synthase